MFFILGKSMGILVVCPGLSHKTAAMNCVMVSWLKIELLFVLFNNLMSQSY